MTNEQKQSHVFQKSVVKISFYCSHWEKILLSTITCYNQCISQLEFINPHTCSGVLEIQFVSDLRQDPIHSLSYNVSTS